MGARLLIRFVFCFLLSLTGTALTGQSLNDTIKLAGVEVRSSFIMSNPGFKKVRFDSALLVPQQHSDLATILAQHTTIFIKSYGNGSLSTASLRGTSASHTHVEWNGIRINSPMLGMTNLTQIPVAQVNEIEILYGPSGITQTSGAFGGVINLVTNPNWRNKTNLKLSQTIASFSTYITDAAFEVGNENIQSITKINYGSAKNDFTYYNDNYDSIMKQRNAQYVLGGISEEFFLKVLNKYFLTARVWYSENETHFPPLASNVFNPENLVQKDKVIRSMIEGKILGKKNIITMRTAFVDQFMSFTDSIGKHQVYSLTNQGKWSWMGIKNLVIRPGIDINYDWVISEAYDGRKTRSTLGLFSEFTYSLKEQVEFSFVFRQDLIDGKFLPFIPGLGIAWKPWKKTDLTINYNISKNNRYPSLNDLYWNVYGNPDLKPETDFSTEGNIIYTVKSRNSKFFLETELTGYYSKMINLITWSPDKVNPSIWRPENVKEVDARGIEVALNLWWNALGGKLSMDNTYSFCKSTNTKSYSAQDASKGKQLIYIPEHSLNSTLSLNRNGFYLSYNFLYFSRRYTGTDNLTYMPGYSLSSIIFGKNFHLNKIVVSLQLQTNNLFDLDYQSIVNYPMPGRNYALTLKFNFINQLPE